MQLMNIIFGIKDPIWRFRFWSLYSLNESIFSLNTVFDADFYIKLIFIDADFCKIFIIFAPDIYIIKDCYEIPAKKHRL